SHAAPAILIGWLLFAACAPTRSLGEDQRPTAVALTAGPAGTLRIAWSHEPGSLSPKFLTGGGSGEYMWIFNSALTTLDIEGQPHPVLASAIPTQENGDFVINPDGTMVTTYRLRPNATWHDGSPITAADYAFAYEVYTDPAIPNQQPMPEPLMASVEAPDDATLVIHWKQPYLYGNTLGFQQLNPLPRHLLEGEYLRNRANFSSGTSWTTDYI